MFLKRDMNDGLDERVFASKVVYFFKQANKNYYQNIQHVLIVTRSSYNIIEKITLYKTNLMGNLNYIKTEHFPRYI